MALPAICRSQGTKSRLKPHSGCQSVAVFEAELSSPIGKGITHEPKYDRVSRKTACLIQALLEVEPKDGFEAYLVVFYPGENLDIKPEEFYKVTIREQIRKRLVAYKQKELLFEDPVLRRVVETHW